VPKSLDIDQDNLLMKFSALNVYFNGVNFEPLGSRSPPYECIKFADLQKARFLLLSTNLTRGWLQIDTDLLRNKLYNKHWWRPFRGYQYRTTLNPQNTAFLWIFSRFHAATHT